MWFCVISPCKYVRVSKKSGDWLSWNARKPSLLNATLRMVNVDLEIRVALLSLVDSSLGDRPCPQWGAVSETSMKAC